MHVAVTLVSGLFQRMGILPGAPDAHPCRGFVGDPGVGSDLDLVAVVRKSNQSFERRAVSWDLNALPVPAEILVYTEAEWHTLMERGGRFARTLSKEAVWIPIVSDGTAE